MNQEQFQSKLFEFMMRHDFSIKEMAEVLDTSQPNIRRYLSGKVFPPAHELMTRFLEIADGKKAEKVESKSARTDSLLLSKDAS
jgi:transcriptional regulator with XRE-family HTH domain